MAQTNYTPISLYYSTTASAVPTAANLVPGELAINTNDGKLYYEDSSGVVQVLATKSTGSIGGSNTQVQFNNSGSLGGSSGLTWDGSFLTTSSIKNSALTSGRVTYAGASGLLSDSANLLYSGADLTVYGVRVGRGAGAVSTNTAVGASALANNSSGSNITAMGYQAGNTNTTGGANTYYGYAAGFTGNGDNNTFIGFGAGYNVSSGSKNTILGLYDGNKGGLDIRTANNYIVLSDGDGNPRGTFNSSGDFLVGTTGNTTNGGFIFSTDFYGAGRSTQIIGHINGASSGDAYMVFNYNGTGIGSITQSGTTAVLYNITSDQRLKTNIVNAPSGNIDDIKIRSFDWVADGNHQTYGLVAQELLEVAPYAVYQPQKPEEMMAVDYSKLVPMMIKEIQDLKARLTALENK
jgi:hypothetical protein